MSKESVNLIQKLYTCYNKNDTSQLSVFDDVLAQNVEFHDPSCPNAKQGLQALKQAESGYVKAFPNKTTKIDSIFPAEDRVVVRWTCTGTHKGQFQNIAPTNKQFKISGISIYRLSNGKISEIWQIWDHLGLLEQLGAVKQAALH